MNRRGFPNLCTVFLLICLVVLPLVYFARKSSVQLDSSQVGTSEKNILFNWDDDVDMNEINEMDDFRSVNSTEDMQAIFTELWSEIFEVSEIQRKVPPGVLIKTMKFIIQEVDEYDKNLVKFVRSLITKPAPRGQINLSKKRKDNDFSQYAQSKLMDKILGSRKDGFFIEAGALDGEDHSNTIFFELERNWTGILIEPVPQSFEAVISKKRHAFAINACIAENKPIIAKFRVYSALSGRLSELSDKHKQRIDSESKSKNEKNEQIAYVPCFSLNTIMKAIGVKTVVSSLVSFEVEAYCIILRCPILSFGYCKSLRSSRSLPIEME